MEERGQAWEVAALKVCDKLRVCAEGILTVCKVHLKSSLRCVFAITGSDLENRALSTPASRVKVELGWDRTLVPAVVRIVALAVPIWASIIAAPSIQAQSQAQDKSSHMPALEYDVASIRQINPARGTVITGRIGFSETPDGFTARFLTVKMLIQVAFVEAYQISRAPDWVDSERYDIDAKLDSSAADELLELSPHDRILVRQQMLQKFLAERFNLTIHRENKELPVYRLITAKNGPKLQSAKPDDAESNKAKDSPAPGTASMMVAGTIARVRGQGAPLTTLAGMLSTYLHRPVFDKTGLTGKYDFILHWAQDENQPQPPAGFQGSPGGAPNGPLPPDPSGGPSLFTAIQEQLGLKLESGKGPVEIIVIDHIEKPVGN